MGTTDDYLLAHLEARLAEDERTSELGVHARVVGQQIILTGTVATDERRSAIDVVAQEVLGDRPFSNDVVVPRLTEPDGMEHLS